MAIIPKPILEKLGEPSEFKFIILGKKIVGESNA
jgi:hypothetical protein